ncbi:MAG: ATP-binding protein [Candidatus Helarchaeota archaeon]
MAVITVLSGKGGVGKTTLTASLSTLFNKEFGNNVSVDTDVDAPNLLLIMQGTEIEKRDTFSSENAFLDKAKCIGCKACYENCKYDAIDWDEDNNLPILDSLLCEGCGICELVCPEHAIHLEPIKSGEIKYIEAASKLPVISGELKIGEGSSGKVVNEAKQLGVEVADKKNKKIVLIDGPPGIGCPVISAASGSNYIILITEPTPAAIHDVKRALEVARFFCKSVGLIINKADINEKYSNELTHFAKEENLDFLGTIPVDDAIPKSIVRGLPVVEYLKDSEASKAIQKIYEKLRRILTL